MVILKPVEWAPHLARTQANFNAEFGQMQRARADFAALARGGSSHLIESLGNDPALPSGVWLDPENETPDSDSHLRLFGRWGASRFSVNSDRRSVGGHCPRYGTGFITL